MSDDAREEPPGRRKLPLLHKVMLALVVALVAAEIGARVVDARAERGVDFFLPSVAPHELYYAPHPYKGLAHRPGAVKRGNLEEGGQIYHINSLGMRGPEMAREKAPGVYRILCVGGSTTFGSGVSEDHATYPARMQEHLNQLAPEGLRYEVGNCGVNGYGTVENLIYLALELVELDPDAILVYQAANDARGIQARGFAPDYSHFRRAWVLSELVPFDEWMVRHVRLYAWATRGLDPEEQAGALANPLFVPGFRDLHQPSHQGVAPEGLDVFFRNLRHIALIARANGILPVFCTFAVCAERQREDGEHFLDTIAAINARLPAFAAEGDVPLLRIAEQLDGKCELFDDWMHFGDEGSDAHGRAAAEEARRLGLFGL